MELQFKRNPFCHYGLKHIPQDIETGAIPLSKSVQAGNLIFISSLSGKDFRTGEFAGTFEAQVTGCLHNIKAALEESGSRMENLVKNTIFIKDVEDCPVMWKVMLDYFQKYAPELVNEPPAVSVIPVVDFAEKGCQIEMSTDAILSRDEPGWEMKKYPKVKKGVRQIFPSIKPGMPFMSESVVVGNLIFLSSMSGEDSITGNIESGNFEEQMDVAFSSVMKALDNAGSSPSNIIKTLHLQGRLEAVPTRGRDLQVSHSPASDRLWKRELEHYDQFAPCLLEDFPASTFLKLKELSITGSLIELDIMAVLSRYKKASEVKKYPLYYGRRGFPRHIGEIKKYYANSVVVGNLVIISGQTPTDPYTGKIEMDDFEGQVKVALDNLKFAVEETGSCLENIAKTYVLLPEIGKYHVFRKIEKEFYKKYAPLLLEEPPASTLICPFNLASPKMKIEIEAIAYLPSVN
jgi:2-iminobutanoate/2-iminopropanoate deaminase